MTTLSTRPDRSGAHERRRSRPWRPVVITVLTFVLAALLNAPELVRTAERQPFGWRRDVLVDVADGVAAIADATRLDRPRRWAEQALDRDGATSPTSLLPPSPTPAAPPTTGLGPTPTTSVPAIPTTPPTTSVRRRPSAQDPLRISIVGDSMMHVTGQSIMAAAADHGAIATQLEYRHSTGLTRPDYFDWPSRLAVLIADEAPEALVVMFGANDAQGIATPAGPVEFGSEAWLAEYRSRVRATMDLLADQGRQVYWVGQPVMRSDRFSRRITALNDVYRSEAERRGTVTYIDSWGVFSPDGGYSAYLDGDLVRRSDGIHLTRAGGDRLAAVVLDAIVDGWFGDRPPDEPGARTRVLDAGS